MAQVRQRLHAGTAAALFCALWGAVGEPSPTKTRLLQAQSHPNLPLCPQVSLSLGACFSAPLLPRGRWHSPASARPSCLADGALNRAAAAPQVCAQLPRPVCFRNCLSGISSAPGTSPGVPSSSRRSWSAGTGSQPQARRAPRSPPPRAACVRAPGTAFVLFISQSQRRPQALALPRTWWGKLPLGSWIRRRELDLSI